jgi:hypothetical protein
VCNRKSEISALVEKKTGFDGSRTLIQGGFCAWCRAGSIFAHDIKQKLQRYNRYKSEFAVRHAHLVNKAPLSVSARGPDRTISVCPDSAAALTSAPCVRLSIVGLQIQAGLDPDFGCSS